MKILGTIMTKTEEQEQSFTMTTAIRMNIDNWLSIGHKRKQCSTGCSSEQLVYSDRVTLIRLGKTCSETTKSRRRAGLRVSKRSLSIACPGDTVGIARYRSYVSTGPIRTRRGYSCHPSRISVGCLRTRVSWVGLNSLW